MQYEEEDDALDVSWASLQGMLNPPRFNEKFSIIALFAQDLSHQIYLSNNTTYYYRPVSCLS